MSKVLELLTDLAVSPRKQTIFAKNPTSFMEEMGLSEVERTAIASGKGEAIADILTGQPLPLAISVVDPGPDPLPDPDPTPPDLPEDDDN